jgi:hypothetical protein
MSATTKQSPEKIAKKIAKDAIRGLGESKMGKIIIQEIPREMLIEAFAEELLGVDPGDYKGGMKAGQKAITKVIAALTDAKREIINERFAALIF